MTMSRLGGRGTHYSCRIRSPRLVISRERRLPLRSMTILGNYDDSAHCRARASASSRVAATRTMERSGLPEPSRLTHAIQCGPRASLWISYEPEAMGAESTRIWPYLHCVCRQPSHRIENRGEIRDVDLSELRQ